MARIKLSICIIPFNYATRTLPEYTRPDEALPTNATREGRRERRALRQRWEMWAAAEVPIRDVEALKYFAERRINRSSDGRTKKQVMEEQGHFGYAYSHTVIDYLTKLAGGTLPLGAREACQLAMNRFMAAREKKAEAKAEKKTEKKAEKKAAKKSSQKVAKKPAKKAADKPAA